MMPVMPASFSVPDQLDDDDDDESQLLQVLLKGICSLYFIFSC